MSKQTPAGGHAGPAARDIVLEARGLTKHFPVGSGVFKSAQRVVKAVDGIDFTLRRREILGLAGESGSGKSTTGEMIVRLIEPTRGELLLDGVNIATLQGRELQQFRRRVQMIFQDPFGTLNPRFTVGATVEEPLIIHGVRDPKERERRVHLAMERAELRPASKYLRRYPFELSGGERQRVAIARAIVLEPQVMVADEPVSMLDVSIRAGILNLLKSLRDEMGLSIIYISHDLSTIRYVCDRTAIMYLGKLVEVGPTEQVLSQPQHRYTQLLLDSVPVPDPDANTAPTEASSSEVPDQIDVPTGCRFAPRCPLRQPVCTQAEPATVTVAPGHTVACHLVQAQDALQEPVAAP